MNKESMVEKSYESSIGAEDLRSEIVGKVSLTGNKEQTRKVKVNLVDTLALNDLIQKINAGEVSEEDKRSEILNKFGKVQDNSVKRDEGNRDLDEKDTSIDDRSEIVGKFNNDEKNIEHSAENKKRRENVKLKLEDTIALDNVVNNITHLELDEKDKRTEIDGMFNENDKGLDIEVSEEEKKEDKVQENVENISLAMIIFVVVSCLVVGAIVGYMLYSIAMNNSI